MGGVSRCACRSEDILRELVLAVYHVGPGESTPHRSPALPTEPHHQFLYIRTLVGHYAAATHLFHMNSALRTLLSGHSLGPTPLPCCFWFPQGMALSFDPSCCISYICKDRVQVLAIFPSSMSTPCVIGTQWIFTKLPTV